MAGDAATGGHLQRDAPLRRSAPTPPNHFADGLRGSADLRGRSGLGADQIDCTDKSFGGLHEPCLQVFLQAVNRKTCRARRQGILYGQSMGTIGRRARLRREELGLSLPQMAAKIQQVTGTKITWQSLQQLETSDAGGTKHLVPLARALGVSVDWLYDESAPAAVKARRESLLVGKVGAGAEVTRFDDGTVLEGIEPPPGINAPNAAVIVGDSQYPLQDGWVVFYGPEHQGIAEEAIGKLAIVQIKDGPTLLKTLKRGSRKGLWRLESWNAPAREDVKIEWAARVLDIRPR